MYFSQFEKYLISVVIPSLILFPEVLNLKCNPGSHYFFGMGTYYILNFKTQLESRYVSPYLAYKSLTGVADRSTYIDTGITGMCLLTTAYS